MAAVKLLRWCFAVLLLRFHRAVGLRCETCVAIAGQTADVCKDELCPAIMDRCIHMKYDVTIGGTTMSAWMKGCNNQHFCALSDSEACERTSAAIPGGSMKMSNCKKTCSRSNIKMPVKPTEPAKTLQCDTCINMAKGQQKDCLPKTCDAGMDRCVMMSFNYNDASGGSQEGWIKQCNHQFLCSMGGDKLCEFLKNIFRGGLPIHDCRISCSRFNNATIAAKDGDTKVVKGDGGSGSGSGDKKTAVKGDGGDKKTVVKGDGGADGDNKDKTVVKGDGGSGSGSGDKKKVVKVDSGNTKEGKDNSAVSTLTSLGTSLLGLAVSIMCILF